MSLLRKLGMGGLIGLGITSLYIFYDFNKNKKRTQLKQQPTSGDRHIHAHALQRETAMIDNRDGRIRSNEIATKPIKQVFLIVGPMFAGKSTELIRLARRYQLTGKTIQFITHKINVRYNTTHLTTHDQDAKIQTDYTDNLLNYMSSNDAKLQEIGVLCIDEGQFFPELNEAVITMMERYPNMVILISALSADYKRNKFGTVWDLAPKAHIIQLTGICGFCQRDGACETARILQGSDKSSNATDSTIEIKQEEQSTKLENSNTSDNAIDDPVTIQVGGQESYQCACEPCHVKFSNTIISRQAGETPTVKPAQIDSNLARGNSRFDVEM